MVGKITKKRIVNAIRNLSDAMGDIIAKDEISLKDAEAKISNSYVEVYKAGYDNGYVTAYAAAGISCLGVATVIYLRNRNKYGK